MIRWLRDKRILGCVILMAVFGQGLLAHSAAAGRFSPVIETAVVNMDALEIVVTGSNLHEGTDPVVSLGGELIPAPHGLDADGRTLTVAIPPFDDGTYLLAITTSKGVASMDITIGVVGPQGPSGSFDAAGVQEGMIPGWPDAIRCDFSEATVTDGPTIYRLVHAGSPSFGDLYIYRVPGGGTPSNHDFYFNPDGSYAGKVNLDGHVSNCDDTSMSDIVADKRGYFFLVVTR